MADSALLYGLLIEQLPIVNREDNYKQTLQLSELLESLSEIPNILIVANELRQIKELSNLSIEQIFNIIARSKSLRKMISECGLCDGETLAKGLINDIDFKLRYARH